ncbi:hypothetical protein ACFZDG_27055 [Kitasatospora xanthocidica]|uniref:hypothetical protein n=1 Tax=Kitasatospora xanthocidica TaxID=83382 RepID=UPI0036EA3963
MDLIGVTERERFAGVGEYVSFAAACPVCSGEAPCSGGQVLIFDRLEWSIDADCAVCGPSVGCGSGDTPADLRERLIGEHGPARLELPQQGARTAVIMKVIRATLDVELKESRKMLHAVQSGQHAIEQLARRLRAVGVEARTVRN